MSEIENIRKELKKIANPEKAKILQRFFKTRKGEYGEGDIFYGLSVPEQREISKKCLTLSLKEVENLLHSKIHEERLIALLILITKYEKKIDSTKKIFNFYLDNTKWINNWDLVDLSAPKVVGSYLINKDKKILYKLAKSKNLWEKRIAIVSTFTFIREKHFEDTLKISEILLKDKHDLIHKAVGWMLREVGKKDVKILESFLKLHYKEMPRTMLRYSIEKFDEKKRKKYLLNQM